MKQTTPAAWAASYLAAVTWPRGRPQACRVGFFVYTAGVSWADVLEVITRELGDEIAQQFDRAARRELHGLRLTIPTKHHITAEEAHQAAPFRPRKAAAVLSVHPSTVYRALRRPPIR